MLRYSPSHLTNPSTDSYLRPAQVDAAEQFKIARALFDHPLMLVGNVDHSDVVIKLIFSGVLRAQATERLASLSHLTLSHEVPWALWPATCQQWSLQFLSSSLTYANAVMMARGMGQNHWMANGILYAHWSSRFSRPFKTPVEMNWPIAQHSEM